MRRLAAIYTLDGRFLGPGSLRRIPDVAADRGPDGTGLWLDGAVGLAHLMLRTTPESLQEKQPLLDESGELCLVLDGRVDNRAELMAAVRATGLHVRADTDAELVLLAYQLWGEACAGKILGDFAFVVWDRRKRQLFAARDILGVRPFYYFVDDRTFVCGSELRQVLAHERVPREPNEGMIAEYLAANITDRMETLYRGILRLPPGHFLVVDRRGLRTGRYWDVDFAREI